MSHLREQQQFFKTSAYLLLPLSFLQAALGLDYSWKK